MLINIDRSIAETLADRNLDQDSLDAIKLALEKISFGQKSGRHIVYGDRDVIQSICDSYEGMEDEGKRSCTYKVFYFVLHKVIGRSSVYLNIKNMFYVNVVFADKTIPSQRGHNCITININSFQNADEFDLFEYKTMLLGENQTNDIEYYYVPISKNFNKIHIGIAYDSNNCDVKVYTKCATRDKRFCLAFIDSDIIYQNYERQGSELSKTIPQSDLSLGTPFNCYYHVIDVRDAENLIPLSIIKKYKNDKNEDLTVINHIESLLTDQQKEDLFIKYFDYEKGVPSVKNKDPKEQSFWYNLLGITTHINGIGSKKKFLDICLSSKDDIEHYKQNLLPTILRDEWDKIGELVVTRCCAIRYSNF